MGASHVGISGVYIEVYSPTGVLKMRIDRNISNQGIIFNEKQEAAGPTGGGTVYGTGYVPGVVPVVAGEAGIWTVIIRFPNYVSGAFTNLLKNAPWSRSVHQEPAIRVILVWDITVTQDAAGNNGGVQLKGRVHTNEFASIISQNGFSTSPTFYVLTKGGFIYKVDIKDADPFRLPITPNSNGLVTFDKQPTYSSSERDMVVRSANSASWATGNLYFYEPQAPDDNDAVLVNNKVLFNPPDSNMPNTAQVTDIFSSKTYTTWLMEIPGILHLTVDEISLVASGNSGAFCLGGAIQVGKGAFIKFTSNQRGTALLQRDINNNGNFRDQVDHSLYRIVEAGQHSIFWDGKDGLVNNIPVG